MKEKKYQEKINSHREEVNRYNNSDINELFNHAKVANDEMGSIKTSVQIIQNDINWMKTTFGNFEKSLEKADSRGWWILGTVAIGIATEILITLMKK